MPPDHAVLPGSAPWVVLDTNVVLDVLLFQDARATGLAAALHAGRLRWARLPVMLDELADVLTRPFAQGWPCPAAAVLPRCLAMSQAAPALPPGRGPLRCADRDDQVFIDLALALPARWLFTRDRALLALAKAAALQGVTVLPPQAWPGLDDQA